MILNPGADVHLVIHGVHDGPAAIVNGIIGFRPNRRGRPETATVATVDGVKVAITDVRLRHGDAYEARIVG